MAEQCNSTAPFTCRLYITVLHLIKKIEQYECSSEALTPTHDETNVRHTKHNSKLLRGVHAACIHLYVPGLSAFILQAA